MRVWLICVLGILFGLIRSALVYLIFGLTFCVFCGLWFIPFRFLVCVVLVGLLCFVYLVMVFGCGVLCVLWFGDSVCYDFGVSIVWCCVCRV